MGLFDSIRAFMGTPKPISDSMSAQGMDARSYLSPGAPVTPNSGYSVPPRVMDYPIAVNQTVRNRNQYGRTSFEKLRELLNAYDFAQVCMRHKIDEIRSMEPIFQAQDGFAGDADRAIDAAKAALAFPDRVHPYDEWVSLWLASLLTYGQGPLYRQRNFNGDVVGLHVVDGGTMYALIDENGLPPEAPAPAYQQVIKGGVDKLFTREDIIWALVNPQLSDPYGMAPLESILLTVNTDLRYQWHLLQMFTEGSIPGGFMEVPPDISSPDQVAEWQDYWDSIYLGDQSIVHKLIAVPNGSTFTETTPRSFDPLFPEWLAKKTCMAFGVVPQDLGFTADVNRANGETQVDIQFRVNTLPWVRMIEGHLTRYLQRDLGLPVEFRLNTGRDKEDRLAEAQAWKIYIESGIASVDEAREELLGMAVDNERPMPRGFMHARLGFVPLADAMAIAGKTDPETKAPTADAELPYPYDGSPGLVPDKLPGGAEFKRAPRNPDDPKHPENEHPVPGSGTLPKPDSTAAPAVEKDMTAGVTTATGITGADLKRRREDELAKFAAFTKARRKTGKWRDFTFVHHTEAEAVALNKAARDGGDADPKGWRADPPTPTPLHRVDLKLTDHWAAILATVLAGSVDTDSLAEDALEAGWTATEAAAYAGDSVAVARLAGVVQGIHADGWVAGGLAAAIQTGAPHSLLDGFTPGVGITFTVPHEVPQPALDALSGTEWLDALHSAGVTVKGIADTTAQRVGVLIERAVQTGASVDELAADLTGYLADRNRAELIAHTELARMASRASAAVYRAYDIKQWDWVTSSSPCSSVCLPGAAKGPYSVAESGLVPAHPRCRCSMSPHIEGI